jgi:DNA polymerase-3 subunit beta
MKLSLPRQSIAKALDFVVRAVERRSTIPILSNVRLEAQTGDRVGLLLAATDLDMEAKTFIEAEVEAPGALTVSASTLHDIVRKLADKASVSLEGVDPDRERSAGDGASDINFARLAVKAGRARFNLQALPTTDWPELAAGALPHQFALPAATLARALAKTSFAISNEETRYYLNGVYVHVAETENGARLRFVATDGHRLARFEAPAPESAAGMPGIIVPRKCCAELARLAKDAEGDVAFSVSDSKIRFEAGAHVLLSKLIDGSFPDYSRVIPTQNDKLAVLDRAGLGEAAGRVATLSSERGRAVKLEFGPDRLALSVNNPDLGAANEEIDADYSSAPLTIGFNSLYLAEALNAFSGDKVRIDLNDGSAPTILRSPADEDLLVVLMPMRVS